MLYDVTLRDGNHALRHQLTSAFVNEYCLLAEEAGLWAVEVGHGNGLGASSYLVGRSRESDRELLEAARSSLLNTKLAVHSIPGFATIGRDLKPALEIGVDIFRVATHSTEASVSEKHIEFLANNGATVHGVLMMSHMNSIRGLIDQAKLMKNYGASAVILMDSAGHFVPKDVAERVSGLKNEIEIAVGFHAHNNLGVAISNAQVASDNGAEIIDGASMGLGAGAGNAQLENIIANFQRNGQSSNSVDKFLDLSILVEREFKDHLPRITSSSIQSGLAGVFSVYAPQVEAVSNEFGIDKTKLWAELGKRRLVAGQESMIREVAQDLMNL